MNFLSKIVFWCILIGLSTSVMRLYLGQNDMATIQETEIFPWYFGVAQKGNTLITLAAVLSFFMYNKYFPRYVSVCYLAMIALVLIVSIDSFEKTIAKPSFFYSIKGLGTYINIGVLFFAADTKRFPQILKFFYFACFFIMGASIVNLSKVGLGASRKEFLAYIRDFTVFLIWVFPYFLLQHSENKKKNILNLIGFLVICVCVFCSGSRSYLILCLLILIIKFRTQLQTKNGLLLVGGMLALAVGGYFVLINSQLSSVVNNAFDNLSERSGEDTRSGQIVDFLNQYDLNYLIQGVGPVKQWFWHGINDNYNYLDNQFLLIAWWAGLPTVLTYFILLVRPLFTKPEIELYEDIKGIRIFIFFWVAACCGFGIYMSLSSEAYYYFISFIIGMATCQYTKLIEDEPAKTD